MKATQVLIDEHRVIMRVLVALEKAATRLEGGESVPNRYFIETAEFIKGFADGCHHRKEEGVLFPAMVRSGLPADTGPIAVMLAEHEEGRRLTRLMRQAAEQVENGESSAKAEIVSNAFGYIKLLRQHIQKEDFILFPMADKIIPVDQQSQVNDDFDRIEKEEMGEGLHEKYLALAERLEAESQQ
jgi:hemerythrin-like domain-containing protein